MALWSRGKKADLLIIDLLDGYPVVTNSIIEGSHVLQVGYRR